MPDFALGKVAYDKHKSCHNGHWIKGPCRQARKLDHRGPREAPINEGDEQNIKQRIFEKP